jgi:hypothetical protein
MRASHTFVGLALVAGLAGLVACGAEPPLPAPPPPPAPPADTTPVASAPPADTTPPPAPPKPAMADLQLAALKTFAAGFSAHDTKALATIYTPDVLEKFAGAPDTRGRDAWMQQLQGAFGVMPDQKLTFGRVLQKGNVTVATWQQVGTDSGTGFGGKPTGRPVGREGASIFWFTDDGLVKEEHDYADDAVFTSQLDKKAKAGSFRAPPALAASMQVTASSGGPDEEALLKTGNAFYTTQDTLKIPDILAYMTEDTTFTDYTQPGVTRGLKPVKALFTMYTKALPDMHQMPLANQWAIGTTLVSEGVLQGTQKGPIGPIRASGKPVAMHFLDLVAFQGGKVTTLDTYSNSIELLTQIGVIKAPDTARPPKK